MRATVVKWAKIYLAVLVALILIAKYPYLLDGQMPRFYEGEIWRTLLMAALGTGLVEIMIYRINQLRGRSAKKRVR